MSLLKGLRQVLSRQDLEPVLRVPLEAGVSAVYGRVSEAVEEMVVDKNCAGSQLATLLLDSLLWKQVALSLALVPSEGW